MFSEKVLLGALAPFWWFNKAFVSNVGHVSLVAIGRSCKKLNGEIHSVAFSVSGLQCKPQSSSW